MCVRFAPTGLGATRAVAPATSEVLNRFEPSTLPMTSSVSQRQIDELAGIYVLVNFWASYCKPCVKEMPLLQDLSQQYPDISFVGINAMDDRESAAALLKQTGVTFTNWYDDAGDAMYSADVRSLPATFILAPDGSILYKMLGEVNQEPLTAAIEEVLNSRSVVFTG